MLITLNFIDTKIKETTEMEGRKWRSNESGREGRNLTEKISKYGSPVICHCLIKSLFIVFVLPPYIINLNFMMISLTLKVLILYKNEDEDDDDDGGDDDDDDDNNNNNNNNNNLVFQRSTKVDIELVIR